jgi:hypothetical protein
MANSIEDIEVKIMDASLGSIFLTLFACVWIGGVCWVLGFIQKKYQQRKNKYQQLKNRKA